ncbi:hypothetical protein OROMI_000656 [Orobanche minor]
MGDSQQDIKKKTSYEPSTMEQSDLLLELMVDAVARGWRDNSGVFTKTTVEERILPIFNSKLGCNKTYNNYQRFDRSHFATSQNFNKTLKALNTIAPEMMVKPSSGMPAKIQESTRFNPFFKDCVGAIDGTHIPAMVKGREVASVTVMWEGSAHDSKLLNDALSRRNGLEVPRAPLRGVRYHLKDFGGQGRHPRNASELFNLRHASLRNVIERVFGIFKSRFTIFKTAPPFSFQTQAELVLACAGLHNFLRKECRSDEFPIEPEQDQAPPHLDMEDEDHELLSQSQLEQRAEANAWRMSIANAMWEMRPMYNRGENEDENNEDETNV